MAVGDRRSAVGDRRTAHEPRAHRTVTDEELPEPLPTLPMVHRRLDGARVAR
ncbi:hypothetical protein [Streptomyces spinosus]|uniref:hypothetical protein n=1 Tax=Streptomyces spinosus TaxID=2872623 RepID=UPI001CEDAC5F|nr:hypothetical protein [Streptomyces spinosus]